MYSIKLVTVRSARRRYVRRSVRRAAVQPAMRIWTVCWKQFPRSPPMGKSRWTMWIAYGSPSTKPPISRTTRTHWKNCRRPTNRTIKRNWRAWAERRCHPVKSNATFSKVVPTIYVTFDSLKQLMPEFWILQRVPKKKLSSRQQNWRINCMCDRRQPQAIIMQ